MFKSQKGITLVALVITIIVMLILAGVSIAFVVGEDGVLSKAQMVEEEQVEAAFKEAVALANAQFIMDFYSDKDAYMEKIGDDPSLYAFEVINNNYSYRGKYDIRIDEDNGLFVIDVNMEKPIKFQPTVEEDDFENKPFRLKVEEYIEEENN